MIVVVIGPGGVGKGTVVSRLLDRDDGLWLSRSWTTRPRRPNEPEDAYTFVDHDTFERRRDSNGFVEWDEHLGHLYGTPTLEAPPGKDVVLEIDVNGAFQVKQLHPDAVVVLIAPPDGDTLAARLKARGDTETSIEARLQRAAMELEKGRQMADHIVVNDDLDRAIEEVAGILKQHRNPGGTT
jgi:guanylate kinase